MRKSLTRRVRGKALAMVCTGVVLSGLAMTQPAQAASAETCRTLSATVNNSAGQAGGHVQGTFCINTSGGSAYLHSGYYNYVEDYQADGVAARAYVSHGGITNGPLGTDSTSTPGGTELDRWDWTNAGYTLRLHVCLGTTFPGKTGARCASSSMSV
ncbi:hypothetical protein ACIF80_29290 [Streptomyces sp. NPDC085927]|uniref:hypothetical protein n=1 Tax=Streptomyces sp. NPDC085927 TaxID=3365738 RepID=UPI0037D4223B